MKKANILLAALSICLAAGFGAAPANADTDGGDIHADGWAVHGGGECNGIYRIDKTSSTCLHAGWDNSPAASKGWGDGTWIWAKNKCHEYGDLIVHIDLKVGGDYHFHMEKGYSSRLETGNLFFDTREIYCCLDDSDLCWERQVKPNSSGTIWYIDPGRGHTNADYIDVTTHRKRYEFCKLRPNYIYCRVDPKGDAFTKPTKPACADDDSCNCGDHHCTVEDCDEVWDNKAITNSDPTTDMRGCGDSSHSEYSSTISAEDGTSESCTVTTACYSRVENGMDILNVQSLTADVDDLNWYFECGGVLKTPNCAGTVGSTHLREIELAR